MNLQLTLRREAEFEPGAFNFRAERFLSVVVKDGQTVLTLTEGPSPQTGHAVNRVAWELTDAERAALLGVLSHDVGAPPAAEFAEVEPPQPVDMLMSAAQLVHQRLLVKIMDAITLCQGALRDMIASDGHEFLSPLVADVLVDEGLAFRMTDAAGVKTYHATAAGWAVPQPPQPSL